MEDYITLNYFLHNFRLFLTIPLVILAFILHRNFRSIWTLVIIIGISFAIVGILGWKGYVYFFARGLTLDDIPVYIILGRVIFDLGLLTAGVGFAGLVLLCEIPGAKSLRKR